MSWTEEEIGTDHGSTGAGSAQDRLRPGSTTPGRTPDACCANMPPSQTKPVPWDFQIQSNKLVIANQLDMVIVNIR